MIRRCESCLIKLKELVHKRPLRLQTQRLRRARVPHQEPLAHTASAPNARKKKPIKIYLFLSTNYFHIYDIVIIINADSSTEVFSNIFTS